MISLIKKLFLVASVLILVFFVSGCGKNAPAAKPAPAKTGLTMAVVNQHNSADDCWLVVNNNIYNVTDYLPNYPGGGQTIAPYCGKEATTVFDGRGNNPPTPQSDAARQALEQYYIGSLSR